MATAAAATTFSLLPSLSCPSHASFSSSSTPQSPLLTHLASRISLGSAASVRSFPCTLKFKRKAPSTRYAPVVRASADYYSTLGVPKSASVKEIKAAYRRLARQYHPDVNKEPGATDKFKEISAAYELCIIWLDWTENTKYNSFPVVQHCQVLSDDKMRSRYDQFGEAGVKSTVGGGQSDAYTVNPFDLFETFFGSNVGGFSGMDQTGFRTRGRSTVNKGEDIRFLSVLIVVGTERSSLNIVENVLEKAVYALRKISKSKCLLELPQVAFSELLEKEMLDQEGMSMHLEDLTVHTPLILCTHLWCKVRGPAGDLYVYLNVKEITGIQRDGITLRSTISISYVDAILGTVVKVNTVDGESELKIPSGTQPGDVLVLSKKGAPKLNKPSIRGDHLFSVKVGIPKRISAKERELLEELASMSNTTAGRSSTKPKSQSPTVRTEVREDVATEQAEEGGEPSDVWKQLKDLAGAAVNGAVKWLKNNL
ncbi:Chaperone protein DnaJ [Linum perenne]